MDRRVVITGLGVVCGTGEGSDALWDALCAGESALKPITPERGGFDPGAFEGRLGGIAEGFDPKKFVPKSYRKATKVMARDIGLAVGAAALAVEDAGLVTRTTEDAEPTYAPSRLGCNIGAGLIATEAKELAQAGAAAVGEDGAYYPSAWGERGIPNLQPLWMLKYLPNMVACHVTIVHGAEGPSNTITCAEASGLLSLGESARIIERGDADACFTGGAESKVNVLALSRYERSGRLAPTGDATDGSEIVKPFDPEATGTVLGEAAGILIVEEAGEAEQRGAEVYAEVAGFGAAHSMPPFIGIELGDERSDGDCLKVDRGLRRAIERALDDAGMTADDIDAVVPHGGGVWDADCGEAGALKAVFGDRLADLPLVTWTPVVGDAVAGNGGVQAALGAMCLRRQQIPGRIHRGGAVEGLQVGASGPVDAELRAVLVCSNSLGGQNAAVVLKRAQ